MKEKRKNLQLRAAKNKKPKFYNKVLDATEKADYAAATEVEGIDGEIAILRIKIKSLLEDDSANVDLILALTDALGRLVQTRYNISKGQKNGFREAAENVVNEVLIPLGLNMLGKKLD
jgi:hypothetical protein